MTIVLKSEDDASVNFVTPCGDGGFFESRFVQRSPDYFIVYLSSHSGCNQTCRFCHLTATGQTMMTQANFGEYLKQAELVIDYYKSLIETRPQTETVVHFNFMARGEPLLNNTMVHYSTELFSQLGNMAKSLGLESKFKVSTIMPQDFSGDLTKVFADPRSMLYYSLYSVNTDFRRKWIPRSMAPDDALTKIKVMQTKLGIPITMHWALITDWNDLDTKETIEYVNKYDLQVKFNLVRYNPYDYRYGTEPSESLVIQAFNQANASLRTNHPILVNKIVPRVGKDVKASCGMFIS